MELLTLRSAALKGMASVMISVLCHYIDVHKITEQAFYEDFLTVFHTVSLGMSWILFLMSL